MPSRLGRQGMAGLARLAQLDRAFPGSTRTRTGPPWGGVILDVNPQILDQRAFASSLNIITAGEVLTAPPGWIAFEDEDQDAELPLGGVAHTFGTDPGQPIVAMNRLALLAGQEEENLAVTADDGTTDGTLFRFGALGEWEEMAAAGTAITVDGSQAVQSCIYPIASPITGRRGIFVWTTGIGTSGEAIYYYPSAPNTYNNFPVPSSDPYDYTPFQARSVAANLERIYFGNTSEDDARYPQRVRWTVPSWTTVAAANLGALNQVGMGALDFTEFKGQLIKLLPLKDATIAYFEDGVGALVNTFNATAPHQKRIITRNRGILGDNAVIDLGGGLHFGLFTDGWFFFDGENWKEAGTSDLGGSTTHKWLNTFFGQLNHAHAHQIALGYDAQLRHIHLTFPSGSSTTPNNYWIYDVRGDRIWPMNGLSLVGGQWAEQVPRCFAEYREVERAGATWATIEGTWASAGVNPWGSYDASLGKFALCHGTNDGRIWQHDRSTYRRGGGTPSWYFQTTTDYGSPFMDKTWLRRALEYKGVGADTPITYYVQDTRGNTLHNGTATLASGGIGRYVGRLEIHRSAASFDMVLAGQHPVMLLGWEDEVIDSSVGEANNQ